MPRHNLEFKAVDPDRARSLEICRSLGAADHGVVWQRDTYFNAPVGRLKLRQESPGRPHLIHYERADEFRARQSSYRIVPVQDASGACGLLARALGIGTVVEKHRHLFLWRHLRIHLDDVRGLGRFIEIEAVLAPDADPSHDGPLLSELGKCFGITDDLLCARGYSASIKEL